MEFVDRRPVPIWHVRLPPDGFKPCLMQDVPVSSFVCSHAADCSIPCLQKLQQARDPEGARRLYERMRSKAMADKFTADQRYTTFGVLVYGSEETG